MSTQNTKLSGEGFSDWKYASDRLYEHEISKTHLESVMSLVQRGKVTGRIDQELAIQEAQKSSELSLVLSNSLLSVD